MDAHYQNSFEAIAPSSNTIDVTGLPPDSFVPQFLSVDAKVGYFLTKNAEIGLGVENLFNDIHDEYPLGMNRSRTLYAECRVTW
jgi:outer membrane receptor protein involved in Fe transport